MEASKWYWMSTPETVEDVETVDAHAVVALTVPSADLRDELSERLRAELGELLEDAQRYAAAAQAPNTTRAYASDWTQFEAWCEHYSLQTMPAAST